MVNERRKQIDRDASPHWFPIIQNVDDIGYFQDILCVYH